MYMILVSLDFTYIADSILTAPVSFILARRMDDSYLQEEPKW
jgi:hypothetical protein